MWIGWCIFTRVCSSRYVDTPSLDISDQDTDQCCSSWPVKGSARILANRQRYRSLACDLDTGRARPYKWESEHEAPGLSYIALRPSDL